MSSDSANTSGAPILLVDYDVGWPRDFEREHARISETLGTLLSEIQHFGSTAIPGLVAKPIIDMMAPVASLSHGKRLGMVLQEHGYFSVEAGFRKRVVYRRNETLDGLSFHLHLVVCPSWPVKSELLFRDWLIDHPRAAASYAKLKRRLADECGHDTRAYTMGKTEFIRGVVCEARAALDLPTETDWSE